MIATDIDREAVMAARQNAQAAGVDHFIEFNLCPFENVRSRRQRHHYLKSPYGERMSPVLRNRHQRISATTEKHRARSQTILRKSGDLFLTIGEKSKHWRRFIRVSAIFSKRVTATRDIFLPAILG